MLSRRLYADAHGAAHKSLGAVAVTWFAAMFRDSYFCSHVSCFENGRGDHGADQHLSAKTEDVPRHFISLLVLSRTLVDLYCSVQRLWRISAHSNNC